MRALGARGVTLLELVIAVAVLALGTAAAWQSFGAAARAAGGQMDRVLAIEVAQTRAAERQLRLPVPPGPVRLGGIDWTVSETGQATRGGLVETQIAVQAPGRAGARLVVWVPVP